MAKRYGGRWEIIKSLDEGGQARVFLVRDLQSPSDEYALKVLKNDSRIGRFKREIDAARQIGHPGIAAPIDYSVNTPGAYYVMEYMRGGSLAARAAAFNGDISRSLRLVSYLCAVMHAAHGARICHRDLKPANILFRSDGDDTPLVADFGICWMEDGHQFTASDEVPGSRYFTAPEIEAGTSEEFTPAADAYSVGKVLYYAISGGRILPREQHRQQEFDLRSNDPGDRRSLSSIQLEYVSELLDHLLNPNPNDRWHQMDRIRHEAELRRRLVDEGHYPLTDDMPCRFCGRGFYREHGPRPVAISTANWSGVLTALYECDFCGHLQWFSWGKFANAAGAEPHR